LGSFLGLSGAELAAFASFSAFARLKEIVMIKLEIELSDQGSLCRVPYDLTKYSKQFKESAESALCQTNSPEQKS